MAKRRSVESETPISSEPQRVAETIETQPFESAQGPRGYPPASEKSSPRIVVGVPLDADGKPDWDRVGEKIRERFRTLLADPETRKRFMGAGETVPSGMDPDQARMIGQWALSLVFQVQGFAAAVKFKLTKAEVAQCFAPDFSPYPDFDKALARIVAKRGPEWLERWADEIYVGGVLAAASLAGWSKSADVARAKKAETKTPVASTEGATGVPPPMPSGGNGSSTVRDVEQSRNVAAA